MNDALRSLLKHLSEMRDYRKDIPLLNKQIYKTNKKIAKLKKQIKELEGE